MVFYLLKKDVNWSWGNKHCLIKNVPYEIHQEEECLDLEVAFKMTALRDLMWEDLIPLVVDYKEVEDIEF